MGGKGKGKKNLQGGEIRRPITGRSRSGEDLSGRGSTSVPLAVIQ